MDKAFQKAYRQDLHNRFVAINFAPEGSNGAFFGQALFIDRETGIEYLLTGTNLVPLLNADGSLKINEKWRNGEL